MSFATVNIYNIGLGCQLEKFIYFRYFPFGVNGMLAGSATVFFAYIGFDSVASTAEEVQNLIIVLHFHIESEKTR